MIEPMISISPFVFTMSLRPCLTSMAYRLSSGCVFELCTIPVGTRTKDHAIHITTSIFSLVDKAFVLWAV